MLRFLLAACKNSDSFRSVPFLLIHSSYNPLYWTVCVYYGSSSSNYSFDLGVLVLAVLPCCELLLRLLPLSPTKPLILRFRTYLVCKPFATGTSVAALLSLLVSLLVSSPSLPPSLPPPSSRYRSHEANCSVPEARSTRHTHTTVDPRGAGERHETWRSVVTLGNWETP